MPIVIHIHGYHITSGEEAEPPRCEFITSNGQCNESAAYVSHDGPFCEPHFKEYNQMKLDLSQAWEREYKRRGAKAKATRLRNKKRTGA